MEAIQTAGIVLGLLILIWAHIKVLRDSIEARKELIEEGQQVHAGLVKAWNDLVKTINVLIMPIQEELEAPQEPEKVKTPPPNGPGRGYNVKAHKEELRRFFK